MMTRRNFLKYGVGASAALTLPWTVRQAFAAAGMGGALAKYISAAAITRRWHCGRHP